LNQDHGSIIHTVVDDPVRIDNLSERSALTYLRDIMATWYYLMMEKYGQSTRTYELGEFPNPNVAWEHHLRERVKTADRYDKEIELCADYLPQENIYPAQVWAAIAAIQNSTPANASHIAYAKKRMRELWESDFQHRF
jgi:hypothetical protein